MIRIEAREMLSGSIVTIRCYHGWGDHEGHPVLSDVHDVDGEGSEQLLVAALDTVNRLLRSTHSDLCAYHEQDVREQPQRG